MTRRMMHIVGLVIVTVLMPVWVLLTPLFYVLTGRNLLYIVIDYGDSIIDEMDGGANG